MINAQLDAILGCDPKIEALRAQIQRLASFDTPGNPHVPTVLLLGATGTGKGLFARVMHNCGPRHSAAFVDVNCAAIPESMLEAELFGFEAGAFTDAKRAKPGLFESATGGTLFLDEIDSLSLPVQSKVLKAIEEKEVRRLGSVETRAIDVKLIAASQADLLGLVERGAFRADLYHRLAVVVLHIPALCERPGDVALLAESFLRTYSEAHGLAPKTLGADARSWLGSYAFPGNVRELSHLMERVMLLGPEGEVNAGTLTELAGRQAMTRTPASPPPPPAANAIGESDEAARLRDALTRTGGNVVRAAKMLGIGRNALRYRMRRLGLARDGDDPPAAAGPAATLAAAPPTPRLPSEPRAPSWEQRTVAVLALSISLPSPAAEASHYDVWTEAARWQRAVGEIIEGFGGTVVERSPARTIAVFGAPRALERLPQRIVQAALAVQRAASAALPRPDVRASAHLGEAQVDVSSSESELRLLPLSDTFTLTERVLGHAGQGEILLSPRLARRVERDFSLDERELQVGPSERMAAAAVRAPAEAEAPAAVAGAHFVGRQREVELLVDAFARTESGHGQVAFIAGEAGIGKSRLIAEMRSRLANRPHRWFEGRCAPYGPNTPFLPIVDGLRRYADIHDDDDDDAAVAKLAAAVGELGEELAWVMPYLRQILSLKVGDTGLQTLDSASRRSELFRALRALAVRTAEIEPLVIVVEDLHWIDRASEDYLAFLADALPTARVLLVLSHRTGYSQPFGDRSYYLRISLAPLSGTEVASIAGTLLGSSDLPESVRALIARKAEGNPFFVEELTKSLLEQGSLRQEGGRIMVNGDPETLSVPATIQEVLFARIDRLEEESRRAIQVASVIGREFAMRLLERITEAGEGIATQVDELRSLELIYEKALSPELAYMFKHALTHDVAYESVVVERRRELHRTIGLAIEELYADRLAEHYETLALHFGRAEDWPRALSYYERSADKAAEHYANRTAAGHYRKALEIADQLGEWVADARRSNLHERLATVESHLSEYAASAAAYEHAAETASDPGRRGVLLASAAFNHIWAHQYDNGRRCLASAFEITPAESPGAAMAHVVRGFDAAVHGDAAGHESQVRIGLEICARAPHAGVEAYARFNLALNAEWRGAYREAIEYAERSIELARQDRQPASLIFSTWFLGKARCCTGDLGGAVALLREAHDLCERIGDRAWRSRMLNTLGWCFAEIGAHELAVQHNLRAAEVARHVGDPEIISNASINLALNYLQLGEVTRALDYLEPIEAEVGHAGDPWMRWRYSLHVHHARAEIELARGEYDKALAAIAREHDGAVATKSPKLEARALLARGRTLMETGARDEAREALEAAHAVAARIGYRTGQWHALRVRAGLDDRAGRTSEASRHLALTKDLVEQLASSLNDAELRRQLWAAAQPIRG